MTNDFTRIMRKHIGNTDGFVDDALIDELVSDAMGAVDALIDEMTTIDAFDHLSRTEKVQAVRAFNEQREKAERHGYPW